MKPDHDHQPFSDLPAALLEDVIQKTAEVGERLLDEFKAMLDSRASAREALENEGLLLNEHSLDTSHIPTTCAADGTYAIERLLSVDLVAAASVIVEGLTPPSETRHWSEPHFTTYIQVEAHNADTATVLRALMIGNELLLAQKAPHDLVMLDGSFALPIIYLNQGINKALGSPIKTGKKLLENLGGFLQAYAAVLRAERSDRQYVALPKYSTRREIGERMGWPETYEDRGLLTQILEPGELTRPLLLGEDEPWHITLPGGLTRQLGGIVDHVVGALKQIYVFYYKPHAWLPALRVEVPAAVAENNYRLGMVIQGLRSQSATGAMLEPYPIYMADRMVKAMARALPTFRQIATQRLAENYTGDIDEVFRAMHGYRSESGA